MIFSVWWKFNKVNIRPVAMNIFKLRIFDRLHIYDVSIKEPKEFISNDFPMIDVDCKQYSVAAFRTQFSIGKFKKLRNQIEWCYRKLLELRIFFMMQVNTSVTFFMTFFFQIFDLKAIINIVEYSEIKWINQFYFLSAFTSRTLNQNTFIKKNSFYF